MVDLEFQSDQNLLNSDRPGNRSGLQHKMKEVILDSSLLFWGKWQQNRNSSKALACRQRHSVSAVEDAPQGGENRPY